MRSLVVCLLVALVAVAGCDTSGSGKAKTITGPDLTVTGTLPTVVTFVAEPQTVKVNGTTTLRWDSINAISASISASAGANIGSVPVTGNRIVPLTTVGTYVFTLTLVGSDGRQITGFISVVVTP